MPNWINFVLLLFWFAVTFSAYAISARPAAGEARVGAVAYERCRRYRWVATLGSSVMMGHGIAYAFLPLPLPLPVAWPGPWWPYAMAGGLVALAGITLIIRGVRDAGGETFAPGKTTPLFSGIYERMRHPQAFGFLLLWLAMPLLLDCLHLALAALVHLPAWFLMCRIEERDLVKRHGDAYEAYRRRVGLLWTFRVSDPRD